MIESSEFEKQLPISRERSFNTLLVKEVYRYNNLLQIILSNLGNTLAMIEGHKQLDTETENTFECL